MLNCINLFYVYVDVGMVNCSIFFDLITIDICEFTGGKFMNKVLVIILNMLILCIFFTGCNSNQSLLDNADSDSIINNSSYDENADAYFKEASLVIEKGTAGYIERATELLDNALYESQDVNRTGLICLNLIESFDEGFDEYFDQQIYEFMDSHLFWHIIPYVEKGKPLIFTKNGKGSMVLLSLAAYSRLTDPVERALDEADYLAETGEKRMSHEDVFGGLWEALNAK